MSDALPADLTVRQIALDYPSLPIFPTDGFLGSLREDVESLLPWSDGARIDYNSSILEGWYQLTRTVIESRQRCADDPEKVVLVGYSQGALVVHKALAEIGTFPELAGVILVADPAREASVDGGTSLASLMGNPQKRLGVWEAIGLAEDLYGEVGPIPSGHASKTLEICNAGDIVCDPGVTSAATWIDSLELGAGVRIHTAYGTSDAEAQGIDERTLASAGSWLANRAALSFDRPRTGSAVIGYVNEQVPYLLGAGPYSMAARSDGTVLVTSGGNRSQVFGFTRGGGGTYAVSTPTGIGGTAYPYGVATDWADRLYVTHTYATTLVRYSSSGWKSFDLAPYNSQTWGQSGSPLTVDRDGNIYVGRGMGSILDGCGYGKGRVGLGNLVKLSPQGSQIGEFEIGNFRAITSDDLGNVYVLTTGKDILRIAEDGSISTYATMPDSFGWIGADMASDSQGNLYVINSTTVSCIFSPITPSPERTPIWRIDADSRQVSEWAEPMNGRQQLAMVSDSELAVYVHPSSGATSVERFTIGTPREFDLIPATSIVGTPYPGETVTASVDSWVPEPSTFTYQWFINGEPIDYATGSDYVIRPEDAGGTLRVDITGSRLGYVTLTIGLAQVTVADPNAPPRDFDRSPAPAVTGTARIGDTLAASIDWSPMPTAVHYQWTRDGSPIEGAVSAEHTLTEADARAALAVVVAGTRAGYAPTERTSTPVVVEHTFQDAPEPAVAGDAVVGATLTAQKGTWTPEPATVDYQWYRNGEPIAGATQLAYALVSEDLGAEIAVEITGARFGYDPETRRSSAFTIAAGKLSSSVPSVTGQFMVGATLSAGPGEWTAGTEWAYQWLRDGKAIAGAVDAQYTLRPLDAGSHVSVRVTGTIPGFAPVSRTSVASVPVANASLATSTPTISGKATVGQKLIASPGAWTTGTVFTYQWLRDDATISKATSSTYTLEPADAGKKISLRVTGKLEGYDPATVVSIASDTVAKATLTSATPTISGTATVGQRLTAKPGSWTPGAKLTYQWLRDGKAIGKATASTYTITASDAGKKLAVKVTGTLSGYNGASKVSAVTKPVAKATLVAKTPTIVGAVKVGKTLTAKPGTWTSGTAFKYQWLRAGKSISGAAKATYKLTAADAGKKITVKVTGTKSGYATASKTSKATGVVTR